MWLEFLVFYLEILERDFLEEYQGRARADYKDADVLKVLREKDGTIIESNDYSVVLANQILRQVGLRTVTQADVEKILRNKDLDLSEFYVDTALVLRSGDNPNEYLAKDLIEQLNKRETPTFIAPTMIPLVGLDLRIDKNSSSGLAFDVREDAEIIYDKILNSDDKSFNSSDINFKTGLPKKLDASGNRRLWTRNSGLSRFYLGRDSNLDSDDSNLDNSNGNGRVVVTDAEGVATKK